MFSIFEEIIIQISAYNECKNVTITNFDIAKQKITIIITTNWVKSNIKQKYLNTRAVSDPDKSLLYIPT